MSPRWAVGQWVRTPDDGVALVTDVEGGLVHVHLVNADGTTKMRESAGRPSGTEADERRYRHRALIPATAPASRRPRSAASHARHTEDQPMNAIETFRQLYEASATAGDLISWTCGTCRAHNISPDTRRRDATGVRQGPFRAECSKPGCGGGFELSPTGREAVAPHGTDASATFRQMYEGAGQHRRELDWARRRAHKTWDRRRAGREAPVQDGPTPSTGSRPTPVVPDPRRIAPPSPQPADDADRGASDLVTNDAPDDGYTTPQRDPATDAAQWLPSRCPGCGGENLTPPPEGHRFEVASSHGEAGPASVPVACSTCERSYTVTLKKHRLVRVTGAAVEAFTRAYEGTREATAPWVQVTCPECGSREYAPPLPTNLGRGQLTMDCERCGKSFRVNADGSTARVDDEDEAADFTFHPTAGGSARGPREAVRAFETLYRRGPRALSPASAGRARDAVEAFHTAHGDVVEATLAAPSAAVRSFSESYHARPVVPGVTPERVARWRR